MRGVAGSPRKNTAAGRADCHAGFGGLRLGGQIQALGSVLRSNLHETPMNTRVFRVSVLWVRLKKEELNKWNKQTAQKT